MMNSGFSSKHFMTSAFIGLSLTDNIVEGSLFFLCAPLEFKISLEVRILKKTAYLHCRLNCPCITAFEFLPPITTTVF